jgi:hypothetical protein
VTGGCAATCNCDSWPSEPSALQASPRVTCCLRIRAGDPETHLHAPRHNSSTSLAAERTCLHGVPHQAIGASRDAALHCLPATLRKRGLRLRLWRRTGRMAAQPAEANRARQRAQNCPIGARGTDARFASLSVVSWHLDMTACRSSRVAASFWATGVTRARTMQQRVRSARSPCTLPAALSPTNGPGERGERRGAVTPSSYATCMGRTASALGRRGVRSQSSAECAAPRASSRADHPTGAAGVDPPDPSW